MKIVYFRLYTLIHSALNVKLTSPFWVDIDFTTSLREANLPNDPPTPV